MFHFPPLSLYPHDFTQFVLLNFPANEILTIFHHFHLLQTVVPVWCASVPLMPRSRCTLYINCKIINQLFHPQPSHPRPLLCWWQTPALRLATCNNPIGCDFSFYHGWTPVSSVVPGFLRFFFASMLLVHHLYQHAYALCPVLSRRFAYLFLLQTTGSIPAVPVPFISNFFLTRPVRCTGGGADLFCTCHDYCSPLQLPPLLHAIRFIFHKNASPRPHSRLELMGGWICLSVCLVRSSIRSFVGSLRGFVFI